MLIRVEIGIDAPGIDALLRRAFESDAEAQLVHDLREDGLITLGLVATDDEGQVVGYVAFSPVIVQGEELQWVGMAPLAVDENYRGQGLARQLVYEGWIRSMSSVMRPLSRWAIRHSMAVWASSRPRITICAAAGRVRNPLSRCTVWRTTRSTASMVWLNTTTISIAFNQALA